MKQVGGAFKIDMAQYFELQAFSQFAADIGPETQVRLARGVRLITLLTQDAGNTLSIRQQVQTLCLSWLNQRLCGLLQTVPEWLSIVIPIPAVFTVLMVGMCRVHLIRPNG
jgi:F0F1-type ATP synthase alpha subunit